MAELSECLAQNKLVSRQTVRRKSFSRRHYFTESPENTSQQVQNLLLHHLALLPLSPQMTGSSTNDKYLPKKSRCIVLATFSSQFLKFARKPFSPERLEYFKTRDYSICHGFFRAIRQFCTYGDLCQFSRTFHSVHQGWQPYISDNLKLPRTIT